MELNQIKDSLEKALKKHRNDGVVIQRSWKHRRAGYAVLLDCVEVISVYENDPPPCWIAVAKMLGFDYSTCKCHNPFSTRQELDEALNSGVICQGAYDDFLENLTIK